METNLQGTANTSFETTLHEMTVGKLTMKLTNEKLFINSLGSSETFALRAVSGIGVVDLVEKYNQEITTFKEKTNKPWILIISFAFLGFPALLFWASKGFSMDAAIPIVAVFGIIFSALAVHFYLKNNNLIAPTLKSAVRIMICGATRDFEFDKNTPNASEVGRFVALIEDTLTSYQRNY